MEVETIIVDLETMLICKVNNTDFSADIVQGSSDLDDLQSRITEARKLMDLIDGGNPLVYQTQTYIDCKIEKTDYQDKVDDANSEFNTLESNLTIVENLMDRLEVRIEL